MNLKRLTAAAAFATPAFAGAYNGPNHNSDKVDKVDTNSTDVYRVAFVAGRPACVAVKGDGDTNLDLLVYDENGNLVASDTDASDACLVRWTPKWTGTFVIKVVNLGGVYNCYDLATN